MAACNGLISLLYGFDFIKQRLISSGFVACIALRDMFYLNRIVAQKEVKKQGDFWGIKGNFVTIQGKS